MSCTTKYLCVIDAIPKTFCMYETRHKFEEAAIILKKIAIVLKKTVAIPLETAAFFLYQVLQTSTTTYALLCNAHADWCTSLCITFS